MAQQYKAEIVLFHVVEGVAVQLFGKEANDLEARTDQAFIHQIASQLSGHGLTVKPVLGYGRVAEELVRLSELHNVDLLVMGGHRHRAIGDLVFGTTITKVRHRLKVPILVI
jgi:manganese transport protein